jgi:transcriptional regulator with XRE-family HTH domain
MSNNTNSLSIVLRQQRHMKSIPLHEVAEKSGVSLSYVCRVESEKRFTSACVLHKIAEPLGLEDNELLMLAGYLSPESSTQNVGEAGYYQGRQLYSYVASVLSKSQLIKQTQCN